MKTETYACFLFWAALWIDVIAHLSHDWDLNPQYTYGWGVPLLALYLAFERSQDRPMQTAWSPSVLYSIVIVSLIALILPLRVVREANPDWSPLKWFIVLLVISLTLMELIRQGGWKFMRHFAFPAVFILTAIPWPSLIEQTVIQGLMKAIAAIAAEMLNWFGIPATPSGNLIRLPNGLLGVDQACSGVRSLQTAFMVSLFLGELQRLNLTGRAALLGSGIIAALGLNLARAFALSVIAARNGMEAVNGWHDPAGYLSMGLSIAIVLLAANRLKRNFSSQRNPRPTDRFQYRPPATWKLAGGLIWILATLILTEVWYRSGERQLVKVAQWQFDESRSTGYPKKAKMPEAAPSLMRYNTGKAVRIKQTTGAEWLVYYFEWVGGRSSAMLARSHSPEICLPATGLRLLDEVEFRTLKLPSLDIDFRSYSFEHRNSLLHVFFCLQEDYTSDDEVRRNSLKLQRGDRLTAVLQKRRHRGQRVLEIAIAGHDSLDEAWKDVVEHLPSMITRDP